MINVYYDGKCGVCRHEMAYYQRIAPVGVFDWVDIAVEPQRLSAAGIAVVDGLKQLHVRDEQGMIHRGIDSFRVIWSGIPGCRWGAVIAGLPGIHWFGQLAYAAFAVARYRWMGYATCDIKK